MAHLFPRALIKSWPSEPIPNLSLSAGGLLALADLQTVARRTELAGGSSWLDALVLAPGLHYQQACDSLDRDDLPGWAGQLAATQILGAAEVRHVVNNIVTLNYVKRLVRDGGASLVTIDVGSLSDESLGKVFRRILAWGRIVKGGEKVTTPDIDWLSHLLYIMSPAVTVSAVVFMVLFEDWWGLSFIVALMLARILNIWAIKHRSEPPSSTTAPVDASFTEYTIDLGLGHSVRLRGLDSDLQAITSQAWLRAKSEIDGYLEACAKLIVYLVAILSGNLTQAGAIILISLLLLSAALLGLSNAHSRGFRMKGRYVLPQLKVASRLAPQGGSGSSDTSLQDVMERGVRASENSPWKSPTTEDKVRRSSNFVSTAGTD